jgi:hypothetical protein
VEEPVLSLAFGKPAAHTDHELAMSYLNVFCRHLSKQFYTKRITQTSSVDQALDEMTNLDNYFDFPSVPHDRTCRG